MKSKSTLFLFLLLTATTAFAEARTRYMVVPRAGESAKSAKSARLATNAAEAAAHRVRTFANVNVFAIDLTEAEAAELRQSADIESVSPVVTRGVLGVSAQPQAGGQSQFATQQRPWGVDAIHAPDVWPVTRGQNVNVAILDTGIDKTHPELAPAIAGGYNTLEKDKEPIDDHGHGTHVAGIIAAADNDEGVVGVAPAAKLWPVKVLDRTGWGTDESVVAGLDWVISKKKELGGAWVANLSLGSGSESQPEKRAIQRAVDAGIIIAAAAGNGGDAFIVYPAAHPGVISVGATTDKMKVAQFSSYGMGLTITAPGAVVPSSYLQDQVWSADVSVPFGETIEAFQMGGSPFTSVTGRLIDAGYGRPEDFAPETRGRIAMVKRGPVGAALYFREKVRNAKDAGASAVVVYNDDDARTDFNNWTLIIQPVKGEWLNYEFPLAVSMSNANGVRLLKEAGKSVTVAARTEDYAYLSGTSMATPHVAGLAALVLALAPDTNIAEMKWILEHTAVDINYPGWDIQSSWGMIDALAAAKLAAPAAFGLPPTTTPAPRRRSTRH